MSTTTPDASHADPSPAPAWLAVLLGVALTLCVRGYRYGESNHAVYLLAALRRVDPTLLANDWWTRHTLQYHFVFNAVSGWLMRAGLIEPAFLVGYLLLAVLLHVGWYRLVRAVGGGVGAYVLSLLLFYLLGAGLGLGSYHFLQDSSFLPSNVSNVAMLWGILYWVRGRARAAGVALGVAGLFHINHALMVVGLWFALTLLERRRRSRAQGAVMIGSGRRDAPPPTHEATAAGHAADPDLSRRAGGRDWVIGTAAMVALCLPAVAPAVRTVLSRSGSIPLREFVDLFVHLRHPHHFDPMSWHWALWLIFLLPVPAAVSYARRSRSVETSRAADVFLVIAGVTVVALLGAGVWFVSETLVQLNLYRFSIYLKLLACVGAGCRLSAAGALSARGTSLIVGLIAVLMLGVVAAAQTLAGDAGPLVRQNASAVLLALAVAGSAVAAAGAARVARGVAALVAMLIVLVVAMFWGRLGLTVDAVRGDAPEYLALARWARDNTPQDAVFLVPPDEQSFRLHARRAIVVNFKNVPQLSAELPEWRDRLAEVLETPGLTALPAGMGPALKSIANRYAALPPEQLAHTAARYGASYVVLVRADDVPPESGLRFVHQAGPFGLYSVDATRPAITPAAAPSAGGRQP